MSAVGRLREVITRERERRHWTIPQWREAYGDVWPAASVADRSEIDAALPALLDIAQEYEARLAAAETENQRLRQAMETAAEIATDKGVTYRGRLASMLTILDAALRSPAGGAE